MTIRPISLRLGLLLLCLGLAPTIASATTGCPAEVGQKTPLSGLWQLSSYREIHGYKSYIHPGDYLLVNRTAVPGEACVEFTQAIEGSHHYYLAMDASGNLIDDTVIAPNGRELRVLIEKRADGISVVLYAVDFAAANTEGGTSETGGGVAGGGRP